MKLSSMGMYAGVFALLVAIVATGYRAPQPLAVAGASNQSASEVANVSVNEVVATTLAANLAETTNLPVANNVANLSVSLVAKSELSQTDEATISKPQIVEADSDRRAILSYTTQVGDTVGAVAARYGVTADTVKWANNLTSDALEPGKALRILPVDGIVYKVKSGDTVDSLASKYGASKERIISFNDLELNAMQLDTEIIIPAGVLPASERPGYVAPRRTTTTTSTSGTVSNYYASGSVGNRYAYGYCTWYVYNRRAQIGRPVGSFWGNAYSWDEAARANGYTVSSVPIVGAVAQRDSGRYGHVAVVEEVSADGLSIKYSDMNGIGGWGRIYHSDWAPVSSFNDYIY